jgi:hypothetical protein
MTVADFSTAIWGVPSSTPLPWKLVLAVLAVFATYKIRSYYRLSHVPGPAFQALSSIGLLKTHLDGSPHIEILGWSQKYGNKNTRGHIIPLTSLSNM